ncbi:MAG TPA: uroporphyrinogen-III synthase [Sphingomonadaceae bacterium]|nr:uroporphyrinogen-III synthase [Sphingomonadaceae bacterium]
MSAPLLVCRPEPGASATAAAARLLGLLPVVAPLFHVEALAWDAPAPDRFDALMMTSANAARHAGSALGLYARLPAFAVGAATAAAMREIGLFPEVGAAGAAALAAEIAARAHRRVLHLCGEHRVSPDFADLSVHPVPVYRVIAADALPPAAAGAIAAGAVVLLHSPRAASLFARLIDDGGWGRANQRLVAISPAAAEAAGRGWRSVDAAPAPTDAAMLAIAGKLCENAPR